MSTAPVHIFPLARLPTQQNDGGWPVNLQQRYSLVHMVYDNSKEPTRFPTLFYPFNTYSNFPPITHYLLNGRDAVTKRPSDRRKCDAGLLLRWLPTLWVHGSFLHYCPPGCCSSFEESCWKIHGALEHVCLTYRPKIQELGVKSSGFWLQCRV